VHHSTVLLLLTDEIKRCLCYYVINRTTNAMQLVALVFIIPWKTLYMFRVLFAPIIRSVLKLYMQLLVIRAVRYKGIVKLMCFVIQVM
jgi:hypothetical protein